MQVPLVLASCCVWWFVVAIALSLGMGIPLATYDTTVGRASLVVPVASCHETPTTRRFASHGNILLLGDSYTQLAGRLLQKFCPSRHVVNRALHSTSAHDWMTNATCKSTPRCCSSRPINENDPYCYHTPMYRSLPASECSVASASSFVSNVSHVLLNVGAGDYLDVECSNSTDTVNTTRLEESIAGVVQNIQRVYPLASIVLASYVQAKEELFRVWSPNCTSTSIRTLTSVQGAVRQVRPLHLRRPGEHQREPGRVEQRQPVLLRPDSPERLRVLCVL